VLLLPDGLATGAVMPYEVSRPKSMCAEDKPERVVDHVTTPTVAIFALIFEDCVMQLPGIPAPPSALPMPPAAVVPPIAPLPFLTLSTPSPPAPPEPTVAPSPAAGPPVPPLLDASLSPGEPPAAVLPPVPDGLPLLLPPLPIPPPDPVMPPCPPIPPRLPLAPA